MEWQPLDEIIEHIEHTNLLSLLQPVKLFSRQGRAANAGSKDEMENQFCCRDKDTLINACVLVSRRVTQGCRPSPNMESLSFRHGRNPCDRCVKVPLPLGFL